MLLCQLGARFTNTFIYLPIILVFFLFFTACLMISHGTLVGNYWSKPVVLNDLSLMALYSKHTSISIATLTSLSQAKIALLREFTFIHKIFKIKSKADRV